MTNLDIVRFLRETAALLAISGANRFRVAAFETAAQTVLDDLSDVASMAHQGVLTGLPGVGKGLAAEIIEFVTRGTSNTWDALTEELPASLVELLKVRGLGPKRVSTIYAVLGVGELEGLRRAAESGELAKLSGFSARLQSTVLAEITRLQRDAKRIPLVQALHEITPLCEHITLAFGVGSCATTGGLRRWCESVDGMDLVVRRKGEDTARVRADHAGALLEVMQGYADATEVLAVADGVRLMLRERLPVRVMLTAEHDVGCTLIKSTGSAAHVQALTSRAASMGFVMNTDGLCDPDGEHVCCTTESMVYAALGLPFIAPELREGRGEIEAAARHALPTLIEPGAVRGDLHVHTVASDGAGTIEEMALEARSMGYEYLCISDHSQSLVIANGLTPERLLAHIDDIRRVDEALDNIRVLAGCEVDILRDGSLDIPHDVLAQLDFVVGSVHSSFALSREEMTERLCVAMRSGAIHAIGHPTGRRIGERDGYALDFDKLLECAFEHRVALEINASPLRLDLDDQLCRRARDAGVALIISSDAHSPTAMNVMRYGVAQARRGWIEPWDVLNTQTWSDIQVWRDDT